MPAGQRGNGTGFGITLIGPADTDHGQMAAAETYLDAADLPALPPLDMEDTMERVKLAVVGAHAPFDHVDEGAREVRTGQDQEAPTDRPHAIHPGLPIATIHQVGERRLAARERHGVP